MTAPWWNFIGVLLVFAGVVLIFFFGMPYRVRRGGDSFLKLHRKDSDDLAEQKLYDVLGWIGFVLLFAGTCAQLRASWLEIVASKVP